MPFGSISVFATIISELEAIKPKIVLDLGSGNGINAAGIRNWVNPDAVIVTVDVWQPKWKYITASTAHYDMLIEKFLDYPADEWMCDCVLMTDVLEHFERDVGRDVLSKIIRCLVPGGRAYVSTPAIWMDQGPVDGNEYETHRSLWQVGDFAGWDILKDGQRDAFGHEMILARYIKETSWNR